MGSTVYGNVTSNINPLNPFEPSNAKLTKVDIKTLKSCKISISDIFESKSKVINIPSDPPSATLK
jgi:hypothetical protein